MLEELLRKNRSAILNKWFNDVIATYPGDSGKFLGGEKDRFNNPVGNTIKDQSSILFDALIGDSPANRVDEAIENIMKIRSVQDFKPSEAVVIVFLLKTAIEETLKSEIKRQNLENELIDFHKNIDGLALSFFNSYTSCREIINRIRINEMKNRNKLLQKRMNVFNDTSMQEGDSDNDSA